MISFFKKVLKKIFRLSGYELSPVNNYESSLSPVRYDWLKNKNIKTIIDVGACDGDFIRKFKPIFSESEIFSFEPNPEAFRKLSDYFFHDKKIKTFNIALSNIKSEIDFYVSENAGSSSMLEMGETHKINLPYSATNKKIRVKCDLLDNIFSSVELIPPVMLKLDVQGAEKLVLEGAIKTLERVDIIYTEINFQELYKNSVLATELFSYLTQFNFKLIGIENLHQSLIDGSFMHADAIFIKDTI